MATSLEKVFTQEQARGMYAALKAVSVACRCNESQGGDLAKRLNRANPLTFETVCAALSYSESL